MSDDKPREHWFSENDELTDCGHWPDDWCYVKKLEYDALKAELTRERAAAKVLVEALEYSLKGLAMWRKYQSPGNISEVEQVAREALQKYEAINEKAR